MAGALNLRKTAQKCVENIKISLAAPPQTSMRETDALARLRVG